MTTKKPATKKVVDTVSPEPDDAPAGAAAAAGGVGPVGGGAPASGRTGAALTAGTPQGYAAWVVPAPVALADAPAGSSGHLMGIKVGVDTKTGPFASWLGTDAPRAAWPN